MSNKCGICGGGPITVTSREEIFQYGSSADRVQLSAIVPVTECACCGEAFTDWKGEEARAAAVDRHLATIQRKAC